VIRLRETGVLRGVVRLTDTLKAYDDDGDADDDGGDDDCDVKEVGWVNSVSRYASPLSLPPVKSPQPVILSCSR